MVQMLPALPLRDCVSQSGMRWDRRDCCVLSGLHSFRPLTVGASPQLGVVLVFKSNFNFSIFAFNVT